MREIREQIDCVRACWEPQDSDSIVGLLKEAYIAGLRKAARMASARASLATKAGKRHDRFVNGVRWSAFISLADDLRALAKKAEQ